MRHSLGTIAWRGLKGRRRDTAMMLCVLAAVFALLTAVLCYQQSGSRAMEVQRQDLYGAWQLARYDLTAADADAFVQQTAPAAVGRAAQYAILVNDKDLAFGALGTVDEGYLSCGQLQLLSGRLPGTAGEAALTTSVLDSIGASYELGQTVTLQAVHGDDAPVLLQFTLCGVLPSYDAYWAVGSNLPVDALVTADSLPQSWDSKIQLLCCYAGAVPLAPYIDGSQDPTWVRNTYAYPEADLTRSGSWAFMGGCALLTLCAVLVLCTLQLRRREQSLVTLRMIGAGKTALVALCLWEAVFLLLFCLPIGSLLGVGLCAATLAVQGHVRYLSLPWGQLALAWATGTEAVLLGFLLPALRQAGQKLTHLPQKKVRLQRRVRLLTPLPLRLVVLNALGLTLALCCVFLSTWKLLPYRRTAASAAVQVSAGQNTLTDGLAEDLLRLPDVQQAAMRTDMNYLCGLSSDAFTAHDLWGLYTHQDSLYTMFTMQDADTVNTLVTALPDAELEALAAQCSTPVDLDALRSGQAVLLYAPDFVLDENGQTQWGTQAAPFAGCTAVLEYPTLDGAHSQKSLTIGGVIASIDMDSLPFADSSPTTYQLYCSQALGRALWAEEYGTPYGYTAINLKLKANASYATQKSIAGLVTRRGGVLRTNSYETASRMYQEGSTGAFFWAVAGVVGAALALFLLWNLFGLYWQHQRLRIGIFQAEGTSAAMLRHCGIRQGVLAVLGALLLGNLAVWGLWRWSWHSLVTRQSGRILTFAALPMAVSEYPWALHLAVCAGYLLFVLALQLAPLERLARSQPMDNLKKECNAMREIVLEARAVTRTYGTGTGATHALRGVDVEIEQGRFTAIIGASGCGKSTLLQALGGLDAPTSGKVLLEGQDLYALPDAALARLRRTRLGFVFQAFHLLPEYTVRDNILLPLLLDKREPDEEYLALLTRQLGLTALLQRQPTQLSGGQQQRAAIARALITRPAVVLADEPTGNLDHQNSVEVFRLLREAAAQQHQTVVYVTHDQGLAAQADRVLRMQDGRIEEA